MSFTFQIWSARRMPISQRAQSFVTIDLDPFDLTVVQDFG